MGSSQLALELLGAWSAAPRAAREDYEHFVRLVARLLGGEAPAVDVQVSWPALCPPPLSASMPSAMVSS